MSKRCMLVDPAIAVVDLQSAKAPVDFGKCILCQQQTRETLVCPSKSLRADRDAGYQFLADILPEFDKLGELPPHLVLSEIDQGDGLAAAFKANDCKWHKSCRSKFSSRELQRKADALQKRHTSEDACENLPSDTTDDDMSYTKRVCTRSECDSETPLQAENPVCFFCDLPADTRKLHDVTTFSIDQRVKECALVLSDDRLLAKLAIGDMVALEAKYHSQCLSQLYNRRRSNERLRFRQLCSPEADTLHSIVFAQLTAYINDVRSVEGIIPVFKLIDLKKLYVAGLQQLDPTVSHVINSSRLKEKLLHYYFPDMSAHTDGRDVILAFDEHLGDALSKACSVDSEDDALHLARAAEIVRRDIFETEWKFENVLGAQCQEKAVPKSLLTLIRMILEGPSIDVQMLGQHTTAALSISQLMVFNSVKHKRTSTSRVSTAVRHVKERETPLPLYIGLAMYASTRRKRLVDRLFSLGICVSYDRVLSLLSEMARGVCDRFELENAVCPPNFRCGIFTTAAVDNLDHNPTSTTAHNSFHGTGISLQQHPDASMLGADRRLSFPVASGEHVGRTACLPSSYTHVTQCRLLQQEPSVPVYPVSEEPASTSSLRDSEKMNEDAWLKSILECWNCGMFAPDSAESASSWSAFHAQHSSAMPTSQPLALCGMLPLFHEHAQSVSMIRHAIDVVRTSVTTLNPTQTPVVAFDQPLFALAKLIQWNWPESHGEDKLVVMFGGLHIEMAALKALGSLLTGSGWVEALADSGICSAGSAEGLLSASHMRRCRRIHEITLAALHILQYEAFQHACESQASVCFDAWCTDRCVNHRQFAFWSSVMQLQTAILLFVRSLRDSDFSLYVRSLTELMPWFFVLDRTNYCRWLSVHVRDMLHLSVSHPEVYAEFQRGKFTVKKTNRIFSSLPIDQVHEQLNAVVKGDSGIIGLTDNDAALNRWIVSGPEVARLLSEFDASCTLQDPDGQPHHENTTAVQRAFANDVRKLVNSIQCMGNPFEEENDLVVLHSRAIITGEAADSAGKLYDIGKVQYQQFVSNRLNSNNTSLFAPIRKNKLALFVKAKPSMVSKLKSKITASRNDSALFARLYIACQIRNSDLDQFFAHENQAYPPSLSDGGELHFGSKSDLLTCLETCCAPVQNAPEIDGVILDGSAVVNMLKPASQKSFQEYVNAIFTPFIYSQLATAQRVDVVFDRYEPASIKGLARTKRGVALRQQVSASAPLPRNWHDFLRCAENKTALFCFIAEQICVVPVADGKLLVATHEVNVKCSSSHYDTSQLEPCSHEEADTRMFLHAADMVSGGHSRLLLRTVDTDVVVLAVAFFIQLHCNELWIAFGTGQHFRYIPVHEVVASLGPQKSSALPVFHAISGCDSVSAFVGRGKKTFWEVWKKCPEVTDTFIELFHMPADISDACLTVLQRFIVKLYDSNYDCDSVNVARKKLFASKGKSVENIPPTQDALLQQVRRAVFQAGFVWSQSLVLQPQLPSPSEWGWHMFDNSWHPVWMTIPDAAKCCPELKRCGCKSGCATKRCKCVKDNVPCTALCACDGDCRQ